MALGTVLARALRASHTHLRRMRVQLSAVVALAACLSPTATTGAPAGGRGVLFIGNSLTYTNDLPRMVAVLAAQAGDTIDARSLTRANTALIDFVLDGSASSALAGKWRHVVVQQGPTTLPICRDTLVMAVKEIDRLVRLGGGETVVLMSWPTAARAFDFDKVFESARMAGDQTQSRVAAAGLAWQQALVGSTPVGVYGPDGYHPSVLGSYLAALTVVELVTGRDVRNLPHATLNGLPVLDAQVDALLKRLAHEANVAGQARTVPGWVASTPPVPPITC